MKVLYARSTLTPLLVSIILPSSILATDWTQFRGPARTGVSAETGLLDEWPEEGPTEIFRREIGEGYSAPTVEGDRLYTMHAGEVDGEARDLAVAMDLEGNVLWSTPIDQKIETEFGNGPRSTPTVVGDAVVVMGSHGKVAALAKATGEVRWTVDLVEAFESRVPGWGFAASPLVHEGRVVVEAGGAEGRSIVALDLETGETLWTAGDGGGPGYNSPLLVEWGGEERVVFVVQGAIQAYDLEGGLVWSTEWPRGETHSMPIFLAPDRIYASGAGHVGAQLLRISEDAESPVEQVWAERLMRNHFSTGVLVDGAIYAFDNATLKCIDAETGETHWVKRGLGKGSVMAADGKLLVLSDRGELVLADATTEGFVEKGRVAALEGKSWTAPVLADGRVYLRNHSEMVAYDLRDGTGAASAEGR